MPEMNTPNQTPREVLEALTDKRIETNPNDAFALALKEALPDLSAARAEKILNRLNIQLETLKGTTAVSEGHSRELTESAPAMGPPPSNDGGRGGGTTRAPAVSKEVRRLIKELKGGEGEDPREVVQKLTRIGEPAVPALIKAMREEEWVPRWWAAETLGAIKDSRAVPVLIEALRDGFWKVRWAAARALGSTKDARAVAPLIDALKDPYLDVRLMAAQALGEIKDQNAIKPLKALLPRLGIFGGEERDSVVRNAIKEALRKLKKK